MFFFCENYCEDFNIAVPSTNIDGDIKALSLFTKHLSIYKNEILYYPNKNLLETNVVALEGQLKRNFEKLADDEPFITTSSNYLEFDQLKSDFTMNRGLNPFKSSENNLYNIVLTTKNALMVVAKLTLLLIY